MRVLLAMAVAVASMAAPVLAQEPGTAAPSIPPSSCAAFTQSPPPPDGATATAQQIRAAVAAYEEWRAQAQAILDCRAAEVNALNAQAQARANEYRAAQAENAERATAFQAQLDVFQARQRR